MSKEFENTDDLSLEDFRLLAEAWRAGRGRSSSAKRMAQHPAYREIVSMGQSAVPFIIRELKRQPDHWFVALHAITGIDPVSEPDRGNIAAMARAWIEWAEQTGIDIHDAE